MDHQIASHAGAILLPTAPAGEPLGTKRNLRSVIEPGVPIEILRGEIGRRRILPGARGIVAAEGEFYHLNLADGSLTIEFAGFGAQGGTDALRADLHDAVVILGCVHHFEPFGGGVRHRLLAVNVLACIAGVDDDSLVPMVGDGGEYAVDVLALEQFLISAGG